MPLCYLLALLLHVQNEDRADREKFNDPEWGLGLLSTGDVTGECVYVFMFAGICKQGTM